MKLRMRIGDRLVGQGASCYIIAEAGINHNGSIKMAKQLIDVARDAAADAVKFQTFQAENIVLPGAEKADYQKETTGAGSQYDLLKKTELTADGFKELANYAREKGIVFLSSAFDEEGVDLLAEINVPAFKIPSGEITNFPLLRYITRKGKPIILSTGMATLEEIEEALKAIREEGEGEIILLHCVTSYPAKVEDMNLKVIESLRRRFRLPIGLSDHTLGIAIPIAAVASGACVIEKHFTLDSSLPGPDHRASLEPGELRKMVSSIRDVEKALGNSIKKPTAEEELIKRVARKSIVARVDIAKGTVITENMLSFKRPGTGLTPKYLEMITGKRARTNIKKDELINLEMILLL